MDPAEAARVLGIATDTAWDEVRRAYRDQIRAHHPDRAGASGMPDAVRIIEAFRVLAAARHDPPAPLPPAPVPAEPLRWSGMEGPLPAMARVDDDTLAFDAPADETFRWLIDAAHDIGEVTYLDRSVPIAEILCQFLGEPATSLVITLQGRAHGTEAFCTAESIESRPGPPTKDVVDVLEDALQRRADAAAASGGQGP